MESLNDNTALCHICDQKKAKSEMVELFGYFEEEEFLICLSCLEYSTGQRTKNKDNEILKIAWRCRG